MFVIVKDKKSDELQVNKSLFLRPTPWKVAWQAFLSFLVWRRTYRFVYLSPRYTDASRYHYYVERDELVLRENSHEVTRLELHDMTWGLWFEYAFESHIYGLFWRFWDWRWSANKMTRAEMQSKLEALERKLRGKTRRIEEDKD